MHTLESARDLVYSNDQSGLVLLLQSIPLEERAIVQSYINDHIPSIPTMPDITWEEFERAVLEQEELRVAHCNERYRAFSQQFLLSTRGYHTGCSELTWRVLLCTFIDFAVFVDFDIIERRKQIESNITDTFVDLLKGCSDGEVTRGEGMHRNSLFAKIFGEYKFRVSVDIQKCDEDYELRVWGPNDNNSLDREAGYSPTTPELVFRDMLSLQLYVPDRLFTLFKINPESVGYPALPVESPI